MAWRGSISRSLISTARASAFRSSPSLSAPTRLRPSTINASGLRPRRLTFSNPREWKRWVISAALPNNQRLLGTTLYLNAFPRLVQKELKELGRDQ